MSWGGSVVARLRRSRGQSQARREQERKRWAEQLEIDLSAATPTPLPVMLREDFRTHYRSWVHPGLHALAVYRIGHWGRFQPDPLRQVVKVIHRLVNRLLIQNVYGAEIDDDAVIGRHVLLGHHQGIQIPSYSVVGDGCLIRHNVTLGLADPESRTKVPTLGRRVQLGTGATLLGAIQVGDDARIGPHALVMKDVPAGALAFSQNARIMQIGQEK